MQSFVTLIGLGSVFVDVLHVHAAQHGAAAATTAFVQHPQRRTAVIPTIPTSTPSTTVSPFQEAHRYLRSSSSSSLHDLDPFQNYQPDPDGLAVLSDNLLKSLGLDQAIPDEQKPMVAMTAAAVVALAALNEKTKADKAAKETYTTVGKIVIPKPKTTVKAPATAKMIGSGAPLKTTSKAASILAKTRNSRGVITSEELISTLDDLFQESKSLQSFKVTTETDGVALDTKVQDTTALLSSLVQQQVDLKAQQKQIDMEAKSLERTIGTMTKKVEIVVKKEEKQQALVDAKTARQEKIAATKLAKQQAFDAKQAAVRALKAARQQKIVDQKAALKQAKIDMQQNKKQKFEQRQAAKQKLIDDKKAAQLAVKEAVQRRKQDKIQQQKLIADAKKAALAQKKAEALAVKAEQQRIKQEAIAARKQAVADEKQRKLDARRKQTRSKIETKAAATIKPQTADQMIADEDAVDVAIPYMARVQVAYATLSSQEQAVLTYADFETAFLAESVREVIAKQPMDVSIPYDSAARLAYEQSIASLDADGKDTSSMPFAEFQALYVKAAIEEVRAKQTPPPPKPKPQQKPKSAPIATAVTAKTKPDTRPAAKRMVTEGIPMAVAAKTKPDTRPAAKRMVTEGIPEDDIVDVKKTSPVKKTATKKTATKKTAAAKMTAPKKTTAAAAAPKKAAPKTTKEPEMMKLSKSALSRKTVKQLQEYLQAYNVSITNDEDGKPLRKAGLLVAVQTLAASATQ